MSSRNSLSFSAPLVVLIAFLCLAQASLAPFSLTKPEFRNMEHPMKPTDFWSPSVQTPYPTNEWWQNLVLGDGSLPITTVPFSLKATPQGVDFGLPKKQYTSEMVATFYKPGFEITSASDLKHHQVVQYDELSVTIQFQAQNGAGSLTFPLVRGAPYITGVYRNILPSVNTIHAILSVNGESEPGMVSGSKLRIVTNSGEVFLLYSSYSSTFRWDRSSITAVDSPKDEWVVRMSVLPPTQTDEAEAILNLYRAAYPIGGSVEFVPLSADQSMVQYVWKTAGGDPNQLIMMARPHHMEILQAPQTANLEYDTLMGKLTCVMGDQWTAFEQLQTTSWSAPRPIAPERRNDVLDALKKDMMEDGWKVRDSYSFGKGASKMGRLALIADELGEVAIATEIRSKIKEGMESWLKNINTDYLVFDRTWGGIVTIDGLRDQGADYGNGWYNDHHFHYGYFLYAAACVAKEDRAWAQRWAEPLLWLARDIANPSTQDPYFARFRHFDMYEGHSWASGLFAFGDGGNQESSSEAINAWYGMALLGEALQHDTLRQVGRYLLASEIRSARNYWHMSPVDTVYPEEFSKNMCVGMVWGSKVVYATFFASGAVYVHGINMLPFTPITEDYLVKEWVQYQYPMLASNIGNSKPEASDAWLGFVVMNEAVLSPTTAWDNMLKLSLFDNGNTLTNTMYWIATRPQ